MQASGRPGRCWQKPSDCGRKGWICGWRGRTHGRKDTTAMLEGLAVLPPKRRRTVGGISASLIRCRPARRPALNLMDELAHSCDAPGSRHPKRWQDLEELLEAGIDVFTTVNVQHLESLNDVVSSVTRIQVRETVPILFSMPPTT
ncbi:hypothetical protein ACNKHX_03800 [Shigella flexneri]